MGWFGYTGTADWDVEENYTVVEHLAGYKCPFNGSVTKVKTKFATAIGTFKMEIWRYMGSDCYKKIGESQDVTCEVGEHEYVLDTPITVEADDLVAISGISGTEKVVKVAFGNGVIYTDNYFPTGTTRCGYDSAAGYWHVDTDFLLCVQAFIVPTGNVVIETDISTKTLSHVIATEFIEINRVALPEWINDATPDVDTNIWNLKPLKIVYTFRVDDANKWELDQMLTAHSSVKLTDPTYGIINQDVFMIDLEAIWDGHTNYANPWLITIELIPC